MRAATIARPRAATIVVGRAAPAPFDVEVPLAAAATAEDASATALVPEKVLAVPLMVATTVVALGAAVDVAPAVFLEATPPVAPVPVAVVLSSPATAEFSSEPFESEPVPEPELDPWVAVVSAVTSAVAVAVAVAVTSPPSVLVAAVVACVPSAAEAVEAESVVACLGVESVLPFETESAESAESVVVDVAAGASASAVVAAVAAVCAVAFVELLSAAGALTLEEVDFEPPSARQDVSDESPTLRFWM
jgi:hypothetical protein